MVQPPWGSSRGQEHRFYTQAGKYTGLFWPMDLETAKRTLRYLNVISLKGFRQAARASGHYVRIELDEPNFERRPEPSQ